MKKILSFSLLATLLVTTFTNCSPYSQSDNSSDGGLSDLSCTTAACINPTPDNLSIKINLSGGNQFPVPRGLIDFNLAGECNEGGFAYNTITWELDQADQPGTPRVRESTSMNASSRCVNGRFSIYINLASTGVDPVNRTGLLGGDGGYHPYTIKVAIFGQNTFGGPQQTGNNSLGSSVSLLPIQ